MSFASSIFYRHSFLWIKLKVVNRELEIKQAIDRIFWIISVRRNKIAYIATMLRVTESLLV